MALSDDDLLDFGLTRLAHLDVPPRTLLAQHADHYRSQLRIAHWLDGWRDRLEADQSFLSDDEHKAAPPTRFVRSPRTSGQATSCPAARCTKTRNQANGDADSRESRSATWRSNCWRLGGMNPAERLAPRSVKVSVSGSCRARFHIVELHISVIGG
jgi:hypothetical protein